MLNLREIVVVMQTVFRHEGVRGLAVSERSPLQALSSFPFFLPFFLFSFSFPFHFSFSFFVWCARDFLLSFSFSCFSPPLPLSPLFVHPHWLSLLLLLRSFKVFLLFPFSPAPLPTFLDAFPFSSYLTITLFSLFSFFSSL